MAGVAEALDRKWPDRLNPHTDSGHRSSSPTQWPQMLTPPPLHPPTHPHTVATEAQASHRHWPERLNPHTDSGNRGSNPPQWQRRLKPKTDGGNRGSSPTQTVATEAQPSTDSGNSEIQPPTEGSTPTQPGVPVGARKARQQRPFKATVKAALAPSLTCSIIIIQQAVQFLFQSTRR